MTSNVVFGDPFFLGALNANLDGTMDNFAVDGHPGVYASQVNLVRTLCEDTAEHGGDGIIFACVPVAWINEGTITRSFSGHELLLEFVHQAKKLAA